MVEAMSGQKRSAEQQVTDEASRKARNPMAARQKISEGQAAPEFQENRERLKAERLAREAELKAKGKKVVTWLNSPATGGRHKRMTSFEEWRKRTPAPK
jgi:hypothetical protein